jgi:hypothetical protein
LRLAAFIVTRVSEMGQLAMTTLKVRGGQIIEHQSPFGKVPLGQCVFDVCLSFQQPIHGAIQIIILDLLQAQ